MLPLDSGLSRRNSNPRCGFSPYETHNIQTLNTSGLNNGNGKNHNLYNIHSAIITIHQPGQCFSKTTRYLRVIRLTNVGNDSLSV